MSGVRKLFTVNSVTKTLKKIKPYVIKGIREIPYSDSIFGIPKKRISYSETEKYFEKYGSVQEFYKTFYTEKLRLSPPKILNKNFKGYYNYLQEYDCERYLIQVENARFFLRSHSIFTKENYHLAIVSSHPELTIDTHIVFKMFYIPGYKKITGTSLLLVTQYDYNYYHCLFQIPAKIWFLESIGFDFSSIDHYLLGINNYEFQKEILTSLGISPEKMINVNKHPHIKAKKLVLTPMFYNPEPWLVNLIRNMFLKKEFTNAYSGKCEKIFVSRNKARIRKILNENKLWVILEKYGFKYFTLENMSIREQAKLFNRAKMVIGAHGAALANTVFCNPGTKVLEIRAIDHAFLHYRLYEQLSSINRLDHFTLLCNSFKSKDSKNASENDISLEEHNLEEIINEFIYGS